MERIRCVQVVFHVVHLRLMWYRCKQHAGGGWHITITVCTVAPKVDLDFLTKLFEVIERLELREERRDVAVDPFPSL